MTDINATLATPATICTTVGATTVIVTISNVLRAVFGLHGALLGFIVAQLISLLITYVINGSDIGLLDVMFSIINGFMLFVSSAGMNEGAIKAFSPNPIGQKSEVQGKKSPKFWSSWFSNNI